MEITLRLEEEQDHQTVENLTREAFWNIHLPGADEHLLIHHLRNAKEFVKDLDFVAIFDNEIIGNIVYVEAKISDTEKEHTVLTFGPLSVLPEYQHRGVGTQLVEHTIKLAKEMAYKAILIYGDPEYYKRFGFREAKDYGITNMDGKYPAALLALELYQDALHDVKGKFDEGEIYHVDEDELMEFDKQFPEKEKCTTESQEKHLAIVDTFL